jgi:hypothetical protein
MVLFEMLKAVKNKFDRKYRQKIFVKNKKFLPKSVSRGLIHYKNYEKIVAYYCRTARGFVNFSG